MILAHPPSGQELETDRVWRVRVKDSGWGSQTGCHSMTGGILKRSCDCSAWVEEALAWTASSRCYADGCTRSQKGQHVPGDGLDPHFRRTSNNPPILQYFATYYKDAENTDPNNHGGQTCATINVPVLSILLPTLLASPSHLGFAAHFPGRANLDGRVLQRSSLQTHPVATLLKRIII